MRRLLGGRLCGRAGLGALLSELTQLTTQDTHLGRSRTAVHLSTAIVDLLAALILRELDETAAVSPESAGRALLLRSQNFIETRLGDPEMDPDMVAAAHHVSTRSLHRAFNDHGLTVSGWIRTRRLDRCRRDLADPTLAAEPVHVIAARWGLRNQAHFSRIFRAVYGTSPLDYRRQAQLSGPAETSN